MNRDPDEPSRAGPRRRRVRGDRRRLAPGGRGARLAGRRPPTCRPRTPFDRACSTRAAPAVRLRPRRRSTSSRPSRPRCRASGRRRWSGSRCSCLGLLLVIAPAWLGVSDVYGLPLGLVALAAGLGWLVLRLWPDAAGRPPTAARSDDGAVV